MLRSSLILASICAVSALVLPRDDPASSGVHLAVNPKCGALGESPADLNVGLPPLKSYKTIVAFGDSYTDAGAHNGAPLQPAVLTPPNPKAGGRMSNGPVWVEDLASDAGAKLMDYAESGAVTDRGLWPGSSLPSATDFVNQANNFINQRNGLDPSTTLYTVFFGMGDYEVSRSNKISTLGTVASDVAYTLLELASYPTYAKNVLVVDNTYRGTDTTDGNSFKAGVFASLNPLHTKYGLNVGYVDLKTIWDGVLGSSPGYKAFGYTSPGACLSNSTTTDGVCSSPDTTFYWFPGNPSKATHRLIADYVEQVLTQCSGS